MTTALDNKETAPTQEPFDLVCVGFGPASLAIAIALRDKGIQGRVQFLERQRGFHWHAGMLLPEVRMQISFLKDLATLRDPTSHFTFINYLKKKNRLVPFTNLSTFLPLREEYNDYMTWCASHFEQDVCYGRETIRVSPDRGPNGRVNSWQIVSRDTGTGAEHTVNSRHVVIAVGGRPKIPPALVDLASESDCPIVHSSSYVKNLSKLKNARSVAVIGSGQSGAEIFHDLISGTAATDTKIILYTGSSTLKPSDDSPFVNEIFDPERVDTFYALPQPIQQSSLQDNRSTNYGVVRQELLDKLYEKMYYQRLHKPDESWWQHRIVSGKEVDGWQRSNVSHESVRLKLKDAVSGVQELSDVAFDLVFVATGYVRDVHETLLEPTKDLLETEGFHVGRDYRVRFRGTELEPDCGVWLQGCCEESHGLSDTLLSILAVRAGELVDSIFPGARGSKL